MDTSLARAQPVPPANVGAMVLAPPNRRNIAGGRLTLPSRFSTAGILGTVRGMQRMLSTCANRYARRHRHPGHLFQGRFKGALIEHEGYFWSVSRHIHLNPVRGKRPLVSHPRDWPWSSYPGYGNQRKRLPWVSYDVVLDSWQGGVGGSDPAAGYRRYVVLALLSIRSERHIARAVAAWLARRMTTATLRALSDPLGLGRPESVSNLTRRIDRGLPKNSKLRQTIQAIEKRILRQTTTSNKV